MSYVQDWNRYHFANFTKRKIPWQSLFREFINNKSFEELMKERNWGENHKQIIMELRQRELLKLWTEE